MAAPRSSGRSDWSEDEVRRTVADYFAMLESELLGRPYVKAERLRSLRPLLADRSPQAVEYKHANISAVLIELGYPYVGGYKPRGHYQALLADAVARYVEEHAGFFERLTDSELLNPEGVPEPAPAPAAGLFETPPDRTPWTGDMRGPPKRLGRKIDFVMRDARNRRLGHLGEQFVVELERRRLAETGRDDLARQVEWVSETRGDGLGYDVLSFDEVRDAELYLEVKTTGLGKYFPFYVTDSEVEYSQEEADRYRLYRVFDFSRAPRLYVLPGSLSDTCHLRPMVFRAAV